MRAVHKPLTETECGVRALHSLSIDEKREVQSLSCVMLTLRIEIDSEFLCLRQNTCSVQRM